MLRTAIARPRLVVALNVGLMVDTVSTHAGADWLQTLQRCRPTPMRLRQTEPSQSISAADRSLPPKVALQVLAAPKSGPPSSAVRRSRKDGAHVEGCLPDRRPAERNPSRSSRSIRRCCLRRPWTQGSGALGAEVGRDTPES
jgi:hypothetical protein